MRKAKTVPEPAVRRFGRRCSAGALSAILGLSLALAPASAYAEGKWTENQPVQNKDQAAAAAKVASVEKKAPDGYILNQTEGMETFAIFTLSSADDPKYPEKSSRGSFNHRFGTDWYFTVAIDKTGKDNKLRVQLVDKAKGNQVLETKEVDPGQKAKFDQITQKINESQEPANKAFKYEVSYTETVFEGSDGEKAPYRSMQIAAGVGGEGLGTLVYSTVEPAKVGLEVNDFMSIVPILNPKQITEYRVKKTDELLATYTQVGQISGDQYTISDPAEFQRYELIEKPTPTEGTLGSSYIVGSAFINYFASHRVGTAKVVVGKDGSMRFVLFAVNPDHPKFKENYLRQEAPTAEELQIPLALKLIDDDTLTGEEKYKQINRPDAPYILSFVSEVSKPGTYNDGKNALTGGESWSYKTTKTWRPQDIKDVFKFEGTTTDTLWGELRPFKEYPKANFLFPQYYLVNENNEFIDLDGKPTNDTTKYSIGGRFQGMFNTNSLNNQNVSYYYAGKGGVKVFYVDTEGNKLQDSVTIVDYGKTGAEYSTENARDQKIVTKDGAVYYYKMLDAKGLRPASEPTDADKREVKTTADETGKVEQDTVLEVTYVYERAGNVNVNYENEDGDVIKDPVPDVENGRPGDPYDTDIDNRPPVIKAADGKTYVYKEVHKKSEPTTGKVESGKTKEVTYVYMLAGNVNVNYVNEEGEVIKDPVPDVENGRPGDPYDTDEDNRPRIIVGKDGRTYEFKEVHRDSEPTVGKVESGRTTEVTYVYRLVAPEAEPPAAGPAKVVPTVFPRTGDTAGALAFAGLLGASALGLLLSLGRKRFGK
ncbi:MAG: MucBP domain-containing protein [Berryella intestinalis]|nr:MucBP domain-containing protein [Berryella intestinalis]